MKHLPTHPPTVGQSKSLHSENVSILDNIQNIFEQTSS